MKQFLISVLFLLSLMVATVVSAPAQVQWPPGNEQIVLINCNVEITTGDIILSDYWTQPQPDPMMSLLAWDAEVRHDPGELFMLSLLMNPLTFDWFGPEDTSLKKWSPMRDKPFLIDDGTFRMNDYSSTGYSMAY